MKQRVRQRQTHWSWFTPPEREISMKLLHLFIIYIYLFFWTQNPIKYLINKKQESGIIFYFVFILRVTLDQSTSTSLAAVHCQPVIKESSRWHAASPSSEPGRPCASVCPISWRTAPSPRCWRTTPPPSAGWLSWWRTCRRARWRTPEASRWRRSDQHHLQEDQQGRSLCSRSLCSSLHTWPWGCR